VADRRVCLPDLLNDSKYCMQNANPAIGSADHTGETGVGDQARACCCRWRPTLHLVFKRFPTLQ
jgi:hypothetical protein